MFEVIGVKNSLNSKYTVIIEQDINDRRKTFYTVYNNLSGTKKTYSL